MTYLVSDAVTAAGATIVSFHAQQLRMIAASPAIGLALHVECRPQRSAPVHRKERGTQRCNDVGRRLEARRATGLVW